MSRDIKTAWSGHAPGTGGVACAGPSRTKQEHAKECDINRIMARYVRTGVLPVSQDPALYGDFSDVGTYKEARDILIRAHSQFENLPAATRERFRNDPARFLAFMGDAKNTDEARKLGLLVPVPPPPVPVEVRVVPDTVVPAVVPAPVVPGVSK